MIALGLICLAIGLLIITSLDNTINLVGALIGMYILVKTIIDVKDNIKAKDYKSSIILGVVDFFLILFALKNHVHFWGYYCYTWPFAIGFITFIPNLIYRFKEGNMFDEDDDAGSIIKLLIVVGGFGFAVYANLNHKEYLMDYIFYYHNHNIETQMEGWKYKSVDECLQAELGPNIQAYVEEQMSNESYYKDSEERKLMHFGGYKPSGSTCFASDYPGYLKIDDKTKYLFYKDELTRKEEYYYKIEYDGYVVTKISKEEYDLHRTNKKNK